MLVIGVDCATQPNQTGMVLASWTDAALRLENSCIGSKKEPCLDVLSGWIAGEPNVLLAFDAPLGWPKSLATTLIQHSAGEPLGEAPDLMFSRATDHKIKERLGKRPFEVGANFIARTAHAALTLLDSLRRRTEQSIPLVWDANNFSGVGAIEVYPAATQIAHGAAKDPTPLDGLNAPGVSHSPLENAARFPQRPQAPGLLRKTNQEEHPGGRRASLMEAMENARRLRSLRRRGGPARLLWGDNHGVSHSLVQKKGERDHLFVVKKTRFGLGSVGHASENPWVMILKNHRRSLGRPIQ